jgi:hypothetical protein
MADQAKPLEWRAHRRQLLLQPRVVSRATGPVSCRPAGGQLADVEWGLLAPGEQIIVQGGSSVCALEILGEDGVRWRGRSVDFHRPGTLTGPVAFTKGVYEKPRLPISEFLSAFLGMGLAGAAIYLLREHGMNFSKEVISIWFLAATSLACLQVWRFAALFREHWGHWKVREEQLGFPDYLDHLVGYQRLPVIAEVIEDGVENGVEADRDDESFELPYAGGSSERSA